MRCCEHASLAQRPMQSHFASVRAVPDGRRAGSTGALAAASAVASGHRCISGGSATDGGMGEHFKGAKLKYGFVGGGSVRRCAMAWLSKDKARLLVSAFVLIFRQSAADPRKVVYQLENLHPLVALFTDVIHEMPRVRPRAADEESPPPSTSDDSSQPMTSHSSPPATTSAST